MAQTSIGRYRQCMASHGIPPTRASRRARLAAAALAAGLAVAVVSVVAPALAATTIPQYLVDQKAACEAMAEVAESHAEKAWAEHCVTLAKRAIDAYPEPTPTATATTTPPAGSPTPPATTPPGPSGSPTPTSSPTPSPTQTPTPTPAAGWPSRDTTGTPAGWIPRTIYGNGVDLTVSTRGAVIEDVRLVGGDIIVTAPDVTIRRVELAGGRIHNQPGSKCANGLTVEDSSFLPPMGRSWGGSGEGVITYGGYTARRIEVSNRIEGPRVGGGGGCGPVTIEDSYLHINDGGNCDAHGDGIQGNGGSGLTVRNTVIDARQMLCGTSAIFYPYGDGNGGTVTLDRVWTAGGGWTVVVGMPGSRITGLEVLSLPKRDAFPAHYGPFDYEWCANLTIVSAHVVDLAGNNLSAIRC